jgi:methionyl-tRNA formyltransferase
MEKRIVFMGSPEFAVPSLQALAQRYSIVGVVTQPDRPAGRGRTLTPPPVKILALELGLALIQPTRIRHAEAMQQLRDWSADVIVVAAYGQILRQELLELPEHGCINVHASLLPRWRGAAPIQAAILNGDRQTGVSIMQMDAGIDTGAVFSQQALEIRPEDTTATLSHRLASCGAELLLATLPGILDGSLLPQPQDDTLATYAAMLKKEDGELDFSQSAEILANKVRAFSPWPGAFIIWNEQPLKIHQARAELSTSPPHVAGQRAILDGYPATATPDGYLVFENLQPAGKKAMDGKSFLSGARNWI